MARFGPFVGYRLLQVIALVKLVSGLAWLNRLCLLVFCGASGSLGVTGLLVRLENRLNRFYGFRPYWLCWDNFLVCYVFMVSVMALTWFRLWLGNRFVQVMAWDFA